MIKILLTFLFFTFASAISAETMLLKCEFIDGKLQRYKNDKPQKVEKPNNPKKVYEIKLDLALKTVKAGPGLGYDSTVFWESEFITWMDDSSVSGPFDLITIATLNRYNGKLIIDRKSLERVIEDGHYQKDDNGNWIRNIRYNSESQYQCKKQDRLF